MNYNELIITIEKRPKFFLRNENLRELDAFLRGFTYANFIEDSSKTNEFDRFKNEWIPSKFSSYTHDWVETIEQESQGILPFQYFFELWKQFQEST